MKPKNIPTFSPSELGILSHCVDEFHGTLLDARDSKETSSRDFAIIEQNLVELKPIQDKLNIFLRSNNSVSSYHE